MNCIGAASLVADDWLKITSVHHFIQVLNFIDKSQPNLRLQEWNKNTANSFCAINISNESKKHRKTVKKYSLIFKFIKQKLKNNLHTKIFIFILNARVIQSIKCKYMFFPFAVCMRNFSSNIAINRIGEFLVFLFLHLLAY